MLQNHLTHVKGELLFMLVEQYRDMNSTPDSYDYESFYEEIQTAINEIRGIGNLSELERFCEEYGLNDLDNEMSFPNLVKRFYK